MRQGQNPKRSRGRNSGRRNAPARHQTFDSNGPSVRVRGNAHQVYEKYLAMARDAHASGDRIMEENYHQHADHYFRIINSEPEENRNPRHTQRNGNGAAKQTPPSGEPQPPQVESEIVTKKPAADEDTGPATNN
ncbi:MAG: DUF4167 domain-containing protein [Pirellulaceae bacterium]|nr:DUF4167 domain-containing protein [Pirellulaceae bacterium]